MSPLFLPVRRIRPRLVAACASQQTSKAIGRSYSLFASGRVVSEDKVRRFALFVAWEAATHKCRVARFAICSEVTEPPATGRGVLGGVLDHKLNVRGGAGDERLSLSKGFIVLL